MKVPVIRRLLEFLESEHKIKTADERKDRGEQPMEVAGPSGGAVPTAFQPLAPLPPGKLTWTLMNLSWDLSALDSWFHLQKLTLGGTEYWVMTHESIPKNPLPSQMLPRDPHLQDAPKLEKVSTDLEFLVIILERQMYCPLPLLPMDNKV